MSQLCGSWEIIDTPLIVKKICLPDYVWLQNIHVIICGDNFFVKPLKIVEIVFRISAFSELFGDLFHNELNICVNFGAYDGHYKVLGGRFWENGENALNVGAECFRVSDESLPDLIESSYVGNNFQQPNEFFAFWVVEE